MVASHLKVIRREKIIDVGGLSDSLDGVQDYDLALKILGIGKFRYINKPLYYHRQHAFSVTTTQTVAQFRKENIARRNYCEKVYKKKFDTCEGVNYYKKCIYSGQELSPDKLNEFGLVLFRLENISLSQLNLR